MKRRETSRWRRIALGLLVILMGVLVLFSYVKRHQIYPQILLSQVAAQASNGVEDEEARALAVFDEVLRISQINPSGTVPIDDNPAYTLIRGLGYCDSAAMAFTQVAERAGLRGRVLFLYDEDGVSPHTVAEIYIDGRWRVFDVLYRSVSRTEAGELATSEDIASGDAPAPEGVESSWFQNTTVFIDTGDPSETLRDRARELVIGTAGLATRFLSAALQDLYLMTPPPKIEGIDESSIWDQAAASYWKARNYDVFRRFDEAKSRYVELSQDGGAHADEADLFLQELGEVDREWHRVLTAAP